MKISIDPGHGGKDPGASKFGLQEKDVNLDIALKLENILRENGFRVNMTRRTDTTLPLTERVDIINECNCDIAVSIHNNAASNELANGSEVIYPSNSSQGQELGEFILKNLGEIGLKERRVYNKLNNTGNDYYYVIRNVNTLSIIVEGAFVTNKENNEFLQKDEFRTKMARAIGQGIVQYADKYYSKPQKHWAEDNFQRLKDEELVKDDHDLSSYVTWGEFATVITRLLDRKEN